MTDATTGAIVLNEPLKYAAWTAAAVVTHYKECAAAASYVAGYSQAIALTGYTAGKAPQSASCSPSAPAASRKVYTIIESEDAGSTCAVTLDRPLELAVTAADPAFPGPAGSMNLAFHRDALALVTRPLAMPDNRMGVMAAVVPTTGSGCASDAVRHQRGRHRGEPRHPRRCGGPPAAAPAWPCSANPVG